MRETSSLWFKPSRKYIHVVSWRSALPGSLWHTPFNCPVPFPLPVLPSLPDPDQSFWAPTFSRPLLYSWCQGPSFSSLSSLFYVFTLFLHVFCIVHFQSSCIFFFSFLVPWSPLYTYFLVWVRNSLPSSQILPKADSEGGCQLLTIRLAKPALLSSLGFITMACGSASPTLVGFGYSASNIISCESASPISSCNAQECHGALMCLTWPCVWEPVV